MLEKCRIQCSKGEGSEFSLQSCRQPRPRPSIAFISVFTNGYNQSEQRRAIETSIGTSRGTQGPNLTTRDYTTSQRSSGHLAANMVSKTNPRPTLALSFLPKECPYACDNVTTQTLARSHMELERRVLRGTNLRW